MKSLGRPSSHSNNRTAAVNKYRAEIVSQDNQLLKQAYPDSILSNVVGWLLSHNSTASPPNFSRLVSSLGISMPESCPGEHIQRAQCLINGSKDDRLTECLFMLIHSVSNNMVDCLDDEEWTSIVALLRGYGILDLELDFKLFQSTTINGFMENLFRAAMDQLASLQEFDPVPDSSLESDSIVTVVKWLLRSGQDPNVHFDIPSCDDYYTPLQVAINCDNMELVKWLLDVGADPNRVPPLWTGTHHQSPLELASDRESEVASSGMVELLFQYGALQKSDRALRLAIKRDHEGIVDILYRQGADISATLETATGLVYEQTALSIAAATSLSMTKFILNLLKTRYPSRELSSFVTADVFIAATGRNDYTVEHLYQISPNAVSVNKLGFTPLHAAAMNGSSLDTCKLLFPHYSFYASTTAAPTPLHFACLRGRWEIVEYLIQQNVNVNAIAILPFNLAKALELGNNSFLERLRFPMRLTPLGFLMKFEGLIISKNSLFDSAASVIRAGARSIPEGIVYAAALNLHWNLLSAALAAGASPNETNETGESALHAVIKAGHGEGEELQGRKREAAALLLQYGAKPFGGVVVSSIRLRCWSILNILLQYGGSFLDTDTDGMTALEAAIISGEVLYIDWIFEMSLDIYDAGSMCAAIKGGLYWVAERLLANRLTTFEIEELDKTTIDSVIKTGDLGRLQPNDLQHLLDTTALGLAAKVGNLDLLRKMLRLRFNKFALVPDIPSHSENYFWRVRCTINPWLQVRTGSPLALAAMGQTAQAMEAFRELLRNGWQPDTQTWRVIVNDGNLSLAQTLYDQGHRLEGPATGLLETTLNKKNPKLLHLLLQAGADPNEHDKNKRYSRTPLQLAVELGDLDLVKCLLDVGANVNAAPAYLGGATALQLAAMNGYLGLAKHLLELDADVNAAGAEEDGRTALEGAAEHGRLDMLELLLCYGASITGTARCQYLRAVKLAIQEGHCAAVDLLQSRGGWSEADEELCKEQFELDPKWLH